ncbi:uncharacterized protein LOC105697467 [Orussus abietinus]|uniref:uncharacterized protein LOC105697467 n=1 Tax=Orussus abietinus TaxID=222816 RepID=UPI00062686D6|nr:uncharacterized protein LOC105697467 [Orussus abietinus]
MGISEVSVWALIRRYDQLECNADDVQSCLCHLMLELNLSFEDLKFRIYRCIGIEDNGSRVIKVRQYNNSLVPLFALLNGSRKDRPFVIDVVNVHQFCPVEKRTVLPDYMDALKSKLHNLENRILLAEKTIPEVASTHSESIEEAATQLSGCVSYLDRRLDELAPFQWKANWI